MPTEKAERRLMAGNQGEQVFSKGMVSVISEVLTSFGTFKPKRDCLALFMWCTVVQKARHSSALMNPMTRKVLLCCVILLWGVSCSFGQSVFIPLNDDYYHLIDRLEIKRGKFSEGFHSNVKPFERKAVVALTDSIFQRADH